MKKYELSYKDLHKEKTYTFELIILGLCLIAMIIL